jgi:replication initiation protein RepC
LQADRAAGHFAGLPEGVESHNQLLAAFKAAAPRLGLSVRLVHAVDWLFRFTWPQDWEWNGRPIVWPSAATQREALGVTDSRVKVINRALIDAGLITMKDSPNGKRYGRRDHEDRIIEAYGFDLSPLATRFEEFVRLAEEAKAERKLIGDLRRRATIARRAIAQILETVMEYDFWGEEWVQLRQATQALIHSLRLAERPEEITIGVGSLERRQAEARNRLEDLLESRETGPKGPENKPHNIPTESSYYHNNDTVMALQGLSSPTEQRGSYPTSPSKQERREETQTTAGCKDNGNPTKRPEIETAAGQGRGQPPQTDPGTVVKLSIDELLRLAPRLQSYLTSPRPTWPEIINAADWLRMELDVSKSLWGEACVAMGRQQAAIAISIISAKPAAHFRSTPGGYFHGMVGKARAGELNLDRTVWALRQAATAKSSRGSFRTIPS